MAVVSLKIGGRFYKFSCNDGQEAHMRELAEILDKRADQLMKSLGFMQEGQLLAMLCLLLEEEKQHLEKSGNVEQKALIQKQLAESIENLAVKMNMLAENLSGTEKDIG